MKWPYIERGDTVLVHSSLKRTLKENIVTPMDVLESLMDAVGERGTLLLPLFNFNAWCHDAYFDESTTKSEMGALTEMARVYPGSVKTCNPIYRFCAIGNMQDLFLGLDNYESLGEGSPFELLREMDGKIAVLDLPDQNSMAMIHHAECLAHVPYRFSKVFSGDYKNWRGDTNPRSYECYVRNEGVATCEDGMEALTWEEGLYVGNKQWRVGSARKLFDFFHQTVKKGAENIAWRYDKNAGSQPTKLNGVYLAKDAEGG